jgi:hypothetical protein
MRGKGLLPLIALLLASCTVDGGDRPPSRPDQAIVLGSSSSVVSLDPSTGAVLHDGRGVSSLGDWSTVFSTRAGGRNTTLEARNAATGDLTSTVSIPGTLSVRVASHDGSRVALMPPLSPGSSPWVPEPRHSTTIVVADAGGGDPRRFDLDGNFEPEAFSRDGSRLFLISYLPPTEPVAYRVTQLDLATGKTSPVSAGKGVAETMSGSRLEQLAPPDGAFLFTLYTTQPPGYAEVRAAHGRPVAFVHTLNLEDGWAHCIGLPKELWGGTPVDEAMAVSPDGRFLYVIDSARDVVAVVNLDLDSWGEMSTELVDLPSSPGQTRAVVAPDGTLFVATDSEVTEIDTTTFDRVDAWTTDDAVQAMGFADEELLLLHPRAIDVIDPTRNRRVRALPSPGLDNVDYIGLLDV